MSIFGKKSGASPVDQSAAFLSGDLSDSGEELTEIEKTRRDLMVARLESFKQEATEQAAAESSTPAPITTEPQKMTPVQVPQRPPKSARPVLPPIKPAVTEKPNEPKSVALHPAGEVKDVHKSSVVKSPDQQVSKEVPSKPVLQVSGPVVANQPQISENIPQKKESETGESQSFITRSTMPKPSRKPPELTKEPAIPIAEKSPVPEKSPEQTKPMSIDSTVLETEKPTWRIKPKVESNTETHVPEKKVTEYNRQAAQDKPAWRVPPKVEPEVAKPAPKKPEVKEPGPVMEKKPETPVLPNVQSNITKLVNTKPVINKPVIETPDNNKSDPKPAPKIPVPAESQNTQESATQAAESITGEVDAQIKNAAKPKITLPYGEVPRKTASQEHVDLDQQIQEKSQEIKPVDLGISVEPPPPAPAVSFEATDFKDKHDVAEPAKKTEVEVSRYYPKSSGRYNHYDQYNRDADKLIDDIMFGIVNADIAARRRQMTRPES